jgi:hypothetical protein
MPERGEVLSELLAVNADLLLTLTSVQLDTQTVPVTFTSGLFSINVRFKFYIIQIMRIVGSITLAGKSL